MIDNATETRLQEKMLYVHTEVNVLDTVLFTKSHINAVVISKLEIQKKEKNGTKLPIFGPKYHAQ